MKNKIINFIALFLIFITYNAYSQESSKTQAFLNKVEVSLQKLDTVSLITEFKTRRDYRNISVIGFLKSEGKIFEQKVKFYRNGLKKEKIIISEYNAGKKLPVICIVKFNDKVHYIEYKKIIKNENKEIKVISEETFLDGKYYKSKTFGQDGKVSKVECEVNLTTEK